MKQPQDMSILQLYSWAEKTHNTIGNWCMRNTAEGRMDKPRALELVDRYTELTEEIKERGKTARGPSYWETFCDLHSADYSHNAYDLFA